MKEKLSDWFGEHKTPILIALAVVVVLAIVVTVVLVTVKSKGETADSTVPAAAQTATGVLTTQEPTTLAPATVPTTKAPTTAVKTTAAQNVPEEAMVIKDSNKTVYYPKSLSSSERKYPVIVWANGTGCATSTYDSLLKIFAEAGYIVVADDSVMTADGTEQRDSIDYILDEAKRSGSKFYQKVDTSKIGAVGHSQGGRSAVNAAQKDSRIVCAFHCGGEQCRGSRRAFNADFLYDRHKRPGGRVVEVGSALLQRGFGQSGLRFVEKRRAHHLYDKPNQNFRLCGRLV